MSFPQWDARGFGVLCAVLGAVLFNSDPTFAAATEASGKEGGEKVDVVTWIIRLIGAATVIYYANAAFIRADILEKNINVSTKYLARKGPYNFGRVCFIAIAIGVYALMVTRPEFQDFIKLLLGQAGGGSAASGASQGSVGGARKTDEWIQLMAVPVLINLLLSRDMDWNPFTLAHRAFRRWAAIPTRVKEPAYRLRRLKPTEGTLEKMIHTGEQKLIEFEAPPKADFEILDDGPRLNWAQARLLMYELKVRDCSGSFSEFFSDPEVQWGKIQADFNNFLTTHPTLRKSSDVEQVGSAKAVFDEIRDLRTRLSYLMAFLLVWNNQREEGIWADLDEIGVKTDTLFSPNPIRPC